MYGFFKERTEMFLFKRGRLNQYPTKGLQILYINK